MRIIIVDDEPLARARLRAQVEDLGLGEIVGEAGNGNDAIRLAQSNKPDLVLLDIRMPGMDGIETAQHFMRLEPAPAVVFTTAYDEHALAAFDANAIDYLLKPIRSNRLRQALEKARRISDSQAESIEIIASSTCRTHISGTVHGDLSLVAIERVRYFHADQGCVEVVWDDGTMLIEESLRSLEGEFGERFIRVHRNSLVAVSHVTKLSRDSSGNHFVTLDGCDAERPVSRRLVAYVRSRLR
ncbi:MAG: LytTR family DNA-binding domain-containing protein [Proteobacteria bacterium]|nr:LytTR family DNA-binding domain-containing protein [Pseudomonadota bacterium]